MYKEGDQTNTTCYLILARKTAHLPSRDWTRPIPVRFNWLGVILLSQVQYRALFNCNIKFNFQLVKLLEKEILAAKDESFVPADWPPGT